MLSLISTIAGPFLPSYQNKVIGVLERALREQSGSRIRRILLRLPCEYDNTFNSRTTRFGMDFIETVSALMNATPGRDLCWLLTRHPENRNTMWCCASDRSISTAPNWIG